MIWPIGWMINYHSIYGVLRLRLPWLCHFSRTQGLLPKVDFGPFCQASLLPNLCCIDSLYAFLGSWYNTEYNILFTQVLSLVPLLLGVVTETVDTFVFMLFTFSVFFI